MLTGEFDVYYHDGRDIVLEKDGATGNNNSIYLRGPGGVLLKSAVGTALLRCPRRGKMPANNKLPERKQNRLKGYDYSETGGYFVTACVSYGKCVFGRIINGKMSLNEAGAAAALQFEELQQYNKSAIIDCYVVMPNHIHAVILINDKNSTSLPKIMQAYKSMSKRKIKRVMNDFSWQRSYYDSIIRGGEGMGRVREYIFNNPLNWGKDAENKECGIDKKKYYNEIMREIRGKRAGK